MSFARMGCDGSDVYVYEHCSGGIVCHWCSICGGDMWREETADGMISHLEQHRSRGDTVPEGTFRQLRDYIAEGLSRSKKA